MSCPAESLAEQALPADGNPSFATIVKVAGALGFKLRFEPVA